MIRNFIRNISTRLRGASQGGKKETARRIEPVLNGRYKKVETGKEGRPETKKTRPVTGGGRPRRRRGGVRRGSPGKRILHRNGEGSGQAAGPARTDSWDVSRFQVPPVDGETRFHDFDLPVEIMQAIADIGFRYCTPIQAATLPKALCGADISGRAQTGTGKSAAFLITILAQLLRRPLTGKRQNGAPRALILAPTRELVLQIEKDSVALARYIPCEIISVFGGMDFDKQKKLLENRRVDIMSATPGRLLDFLRRGVIHLDEVEILVIDEADRMLDMGFIPDVRRIIRRTPPKSGRQTMLYGATLTPEVTRLTSQWTRDPISVEIEPEQVAVDTVDQQFYIVTREGKFALLYNLIMRKNLRRVLVFCNRRDRARQLTDKLKDYGINCALLSGEVEQRTRIKRLENFRAGRIRVIVATDVAARGLHIEAISHVVNFNLPRDPEDYVHRIGRTGRATAAGISVSFACEDDSFEIPVIEEFIGEKISCWHPDDDWLVVPPRPRGSNRQSRRRPPRTRRNAFKGDREKGSRTYQR